jgi:hypothetical protein
VCVKEENVTASAKDLFTHLHLDKGKYKESGVGSSWNIVRLFREFLVEMHSELYVGFSAA